MVEKNTIANVIIGAIWIGSLIFLIWFCVVQFQNLKHTAVVTTSFSSPEAITYPGLFICPSTETVVKAVPANGPIYVQTGYGASFVPFRPYDSDNTPRGYAVCPRIVTFETTDGKTVGCLDFPQNPVFNLTATEADPDNKPDCPALNPTAYWYKESTAVANPTGGVWTATSVGNGLYVDFQSENIVSEPYMVLLYSAATRLQPPTDFASYVAMFSLTNFFLAHIPLMSYSALNVDKLKTDAWPIDTNCNYEGFLSAVSQFNVNPPPEGSSFRASSILLGFDILEEVQTCHSPLSNGADVLGIVGGGVALVLAITIAIHMAVNKCLGDKQDTHNNVQSANYRPLGGDAL